MKRDRLASVPPTQCAPRIAGHASQACGPLVLSLLLIAGCGRGEVFGLMNPDAADSGAALEKDSEVVGADSEVDTGFETDGEVDSGIHIDNEAGIADGGEEVLDAMEDSGTSTEAGDGGLDPDGGVEEDGGPPPNDGGIPSACTVDQDCGLNGHCDPQSLTCVDCYDDMHCAGTRVCDQTHGNVCANPCFMGQCGPFGVCEPTEDVCVECLQDSDCDGNQLCNPNTLTCVQCSTNSDCALNPGHSICDTTAGECVGCISDADCAANEECSPLSGGTCLPPMARGLCDPCTTDDQCGGPDDLCIGIIGTGGLIDRTCGIDCAADPTICPSGFECIAVRNGEMQCRPSYEMQTPTCAATRNLGAACVLDPNLLDPGCGIDGVQDARCESTVAGGAGQCVVWCVDDADCANGTTCQPGTNGMDVCR